jgi:hypothetical protein
MTESSDPSRRRRIALGVLALGWTAALAVFLAAAPVAEDPDVYDLEHSRTYDRQLEIIGGKAAVMGKEIDDWLVGLVEGRNLAYTIAAVTGLVAAAVWLWPAREEGADDDPGPL